MKISRNKLKRLVEQSMKKVLVNEATKKATNWDEYVAVGKTEEEQNERRKLKLLWRIWTHPTQAQVELSTNPKVNLPVNPTDGYDLEYSGWVAWYKDMIKNPDAMASMGKKVGQHFSVDDHFKYVEKYFPDGAKIPSMKLKEKETTQEVVSDLMAGLNFGDAADSRIDFDEKWLRTAKEKVIAVAKRSANISFDFDKEFKAIEQDVNKIINSNDPFDRFQVHTFSLQKVSDPSKAKKISGFLDAIGIAMPSDEEKANSKKYQKALADAERSPEFSKISNSKAELGPNRKAAGDEDSVEESREINENRIRAIIRHELIQSMRK